MWRSLRFRLSGYLMAACLYVMPRSRQRELLIDAVDGWMATAAKELMGRDIGLRVHQRYR